MNFRAVTFALAASLSLAAPAFAQYAPPYDDYPPPNDDRASANHNYVRGRYPNGYDQAGYVPFDELQSISDTVPVNKPVETLDGTYVGKVTDIYLTGSLVTRLQIHITPSRLVWVNSARLRYDPARDVVVTDLTVDQMAGRSQLDF